MLDGMADRSPWKRRAATWFVRNTRAIAYPKTWDSCLALTDFRILAYFINGVG